MFLKLTLNHFFRINLLVPIPKIDEQEKIATIISNTESQLLLEIQQKSSLENLKKGLMQKLLTGQLRV